jgi:toxin FitB
MSGFLLDTNVPSELMRTQPDPKVTAWVAAQDLGSLFLSVVSLGELRKGLTIMSAGKRKTELEVWLETDLLKLFSGRILPMTKTIAERWGVLEGQRQLMGHPLNVPEPRLPRPR